MSKPSRGLQDIRTLSGKVGKSHHPYKAFLRISHIEMEKARRLQESAAARQLIADTAARIQELEEEKDGLLKGMGERSGRLEPQPAPPRSTGGFKVRY